MWARAGDRRGAVGASHNHASEGACSCTMGDDDSDMEDDEEDDGYIPREELINAKDEETMETGLHASARGAKWEVVRWLVERGGDVGEREVEGKTVVDIVRMQAGEEGVRELEAVVRAVHSQ